MWSRRQLLRSGVPAAAWLAAPGILRAAAAQRRWTSMPFMLGVASGAPTAHSFVAWTRLAPDPLGMDPLRPGGMDGDDVLLRYEVAEEPGMRRIVATGAAVAEARFAHSVHARIEGLRPGRDYWFRFVSGDASSDVGRARTLPAAGAPVPSLRIGFVSCANFEHGYFASYRHLATEQADFLVFLGDYIYEGVDRQSTNLVRRHSGGEEARTLADYRNRYAQYHLDADLRRLRAGSTSLVIWDDHEVANDYGGLWAQDGSPLEAFAQRRAAAYQAFYEHMPVSPLRTPSGPALRVYDRLQVGQLVTVHLTDARQYRSRPPCYAAPATPPGRMITDRECGERLQYDRSMLGWEQERWLHEGLVSSRTSWNLLAQSVLMAQLRRRSAEDEAIYWTDDWNGYPAGRTRLLTQLHQARVHNTLVIGGDIHSFWANDLKLDFDSEKSPVVATEFVGTSISSHQPTFDFAAALHENPHIRYFDKAWRGYATLRLTPRLAEVAFRAISDATHPDATVRTLRSFAVDVNRPGVMPG